MEPILVSLPDPSTLDGDFATVLTAFNTLSTKAKGFSLTDLESLLEIGQNLPIPNSLTLVEGTLNDLNRMVQIIPADPEQLTSVLQEGLGQLVADVTGISELLTPLAIIVDLVAPTLDQFTFLSQMVTRINSIITELPQQASGLNLINIPDQFEYFSNIFEVYPEAASISVFVELKAQIDTLKDWLTLDAAALTENFRDQVQTLASALPVQVDGVMQMGLDTMNAIEAPFPALAKTAWYDPYAAAMTVIEAIDLTNLDQSQIDAFLTILDNQVTAVTATANTLGQNAQDILNELDNLHFFPQDLRNAFLDIVDIISPEKPGIVAVLFHQIRSVIGSIEMSTLNAIVAQVEQKVEEVIGDFDFATINQAVIETAERVTSTVQSVDQALVEVAITLSNLVNELQNLISNVNLPSLLSQIRDAFSQLRDEANALLTRVENISTEINTFVTGIGQDMAKLDMGALTNAIEGLLMDIVSVLDAPEIRVTLETAEKGINEIAQNLENVTLKPIFDRVVEETDDLKTKLAAVDIDELNDFVKASLAAALEIIRNIDFVSQVADVLKDKLETIFDQSTDLVKPLQEKYGEIHKHIDQFNPEMAVSNTLSPPFDELLKVLDQIEPTQILTPLQELESSLLAQLEPLNPSTLLTPLTGLHTQLINALRLLSPHDLIAPLNDMLDQVTGLLDELQIETLIAQISDSVGQINTLLGDFALGEQIQDSDLWPALTQIDVQGNALLADMENQIPQFLDHIVAHIPDVDMSVLQPALDELDASITTIENHMNNPAILARTDALCANLSMQDFGGGVMELTQRWLAQKARFEAVTPPAELVGSYQTLKECLNNLSPIALLSGPATLVDQIEALLETMQTELTQMRDSLVKLLAANQDKLDALLPNQPTAAGFKTLLRETLDDQWGKPIQATLQLVKKRMQEFSQVINAIKTVALKFQAPFAALTIIPDSINLVGDALIEAKNKIAGINLNFLEDELQGALDEALSQLEGLDPTALLVDLDTFYQGALTALGGLYPETTIQNLVTIYQNSVLEKITALHPDKTVAGPLEATYQKILELLAKLDVTQIFEALTKSLDTIEQELNAGLDQAAAAFNELLATLPSLSVAASATF